MKCPIPCFACGLLFVFAASAKEDLTTLEGLQTAFRRAHDAHDLQQMQNLVCWARTTEAMQKDMREKLETSFCCDIDDMRLEKPDALDKKQLWNVRPMRVLAVSYHGFPKPRSTYVLRDWYPFAKYHGSYRFVISHEPRQRTPKFWAQ